MFQFLRFLHFVLKVSLENRSKCHFTHWPHSKANGSVNRKFGGWDLTVAINKFVSEIHQKQKQKRDKSCFLYYFFFGFRITNGCARSRSVEAHQNTSARIFLERNGKIK